MGMALAIATGGNIVTGGGTGSVQITDVEHPHITAHVLVPSTANATLLQPETLLAESQETEVQSSVLSSVSLEPKTMSSTELRPVIVSAGEE